jgi:membrane protease YdiL (CAAX protease family)
MLAVAAETVQAIDLVFLALGGIVALALAAAQARRGDRRNPLAGRTPPGSSELAWPAVLAALAVMLATNLLVQSLSGVPGDPPAAGSHAWHLGQVADSGAKLAAAATMALFLYAAHRTRRPGTTAASSRWSTILFVVVLGVLALTSIATLQLSASKTVWRWWQPETLQPVHPVLTALKESAWNTSFPWGTLQLWLAAVVVAPISEELFFRGVLLGGLHRTLGHTWLAILVSSGIFGFIHGNQPQDVLPLAIFGAGLAFVCVRWRSLTACILIHALFNLRTMIQATLVPQLIDA